jgi:hypothetical protein
VAEIPTLTAEEEGDLFDFASEDLGEVVDGLAAEGVDVEAFLSNMAAADIDAKFRIRRALTYKLAQQEAARDREVERVKALSARRIDKTAAALAGIESSLLAAAKDVREKSGGKVKGVASMLYGSLSLRPPTPSLEVVDEGPALEWLADKAPEAIRTIPERREVAKADAKKAMIARGETEAPGLRLVTPEEPVATWRTVWPSAAEEGGDEA